MRVWSRSGFGGMHGTCGGARPEKRIEMEGMQWRAENGEMEDDMGRSRREPHVDDFLGGRAVDYCDEKMQL